jgi:hypothetical protein
MERIESLIGLIILVVKEDEELKWNQVQEFLNRKEGKQLIEKISQTVSGLNIQGKDNKDENTKENVKSKTISDLPSPVRVSATVSSTPSPSSSKVEKVPTPAKKTVKKVPTPQANLVQSTLATATVSGSSTSTQPVVLSQHPLMTGEPLEKTTKKPKQSVPENYNGPTCKYVFKRGELKGKECGKPAMSDSEYCELCNQKKTNKPMDAKDEKPKEKKTKAVENKPMVGFTTSVGKRAAEKPKIELRETGQPNTYVDIATNIVVKKVVDQERTLFVAIGIQEESGFRTLNEEEKKEALSRSFTLPGGPGTESMRSPRREGIKSPVKSPAREKSDEVKGEGKGEAKGEVKGEAKGENKKIVSKQPTNVIPDIESDDE